MVIDNTCAERMNSSLPASAISMPTAFVTQEHLMLTSALISSRGKEEERMHLSPPWMASVQAQSTDTRANWLSFDWVGHPAGFLWKGGREEC